MDRTAFLKLLSTEFYPSLRKDGFKGSGTTLRRHDGKFHHIVNIQGSSSATGCYINLGAHIDFLPAEGGGAFSPADFDEPSCAFRIRLVSRTGERWSYGSREAETLTAIQEVIEAWGSQGRAFFDKFGGNNETENLERLVQELEGPAVHPARALLGARIAAHSGQNRRALEIATSAVERVGEKATGLRAKLKEFVLAASARQ